MENKFSPTQLAVSISLIIGSGLAYYSSHALAACAEYISGQCGLAENDMTTPFDPQPRAWYFSLPTQDAAIKGAVKAQNIYFASGTSSRLTGDRQNLTIDGANLNGYYINASKNGSASITLVNKASVDWIEAGGGSTNKTNVNITVDNSTLNGASAENDYDQTNKTPHSKNYARGSAIYLSYYDTGDNIINVTHGSILNGRILTGSAGKNQIALKDSEINRGNINVAYAKEDIAIALNNSAVDTSAAAIANENAIVISGNNPGKTNSVILNNSSRLNGSLKISAPGSLNTLSITGGSAVSATTSAKAIDVVSGLSTQLNLADSAIKGNIAIASSESISASVAASQLQGDIILSKAITSALQMTGGELTGSINASAVTGEVDLRLRDTRVSGDVIFSDGTVTRAMVTLDNTQIGGHLYGSDNATLTLAETVRQFRGDKFSRFSNLNILGATSLSGGFNASNVGSQLQVNGGTIGAPVALNVGRLIFNQATLIADTLSLRDSASLEITNNSLLETRSAQLFSSAASVDGTTGLNETGARLTFSNSTLALTDESYHLAWLKSVAPLFAAQAGFQLVMTGTLLNEDKVTGSASLADAATAGAVLANVEVVADKNRLVIGSSTPVTDNETAVENSFGAAKLRLEGTGDSSVAIVGGKSLTLTGATGGALIEIAGSQNAAVSVSVEDGSLNLGTRVSGETTSFLRGHISVGNAGNLNIVAGDHTIVSTAGAPGIVSQGHVLIGSQAALHSDVLLSGAGDIAVNGNLLASHLTAQADAAGGVSDAQIYVGNHDAAGRLSAEAVNLQGARLFIDPQWQADSTIATASHAALGGHSVNGRLTAGQNALLVLGDTQTQTAIADFADSGLSWSPTGITAALAIERPQHLVASQGGIRIDGRLTQASAGYDAAINRVQFGERSLLMVNRESTTGGKAALNATDGTLTVASSSALYVKDARANQSYTIASGFSDIQIEGAGWQKQNLILNKLLAASTTAHNGTVTVTTAAKTADVVLPGVVTPHALNSMIVSGSNAVNSPSAGLRFLSQAVESPRASVSEVVKTLNSAAQMAIAAGVQASTLATGQAAAQAIQQHSSLANRALRDADNEAWAQALYGHQRARALSAGSNDYGFDTDYYGLIVGGEKAWRSRIGEMRTGAAVYAGNGDTDSKGDFNATHNDFNFWGISLYQSWRQDALNLTADVGYSANNNDIDQNLPGWANQGNKLKSSVDSQLLTVGLTGEYLLNTTALDIIPYAGARYNQLKTKGFTTKNASREVLFHTGEETQTIWQFPAGVKLNKTFDLDAGWGVSALADLAVVTNAGDTRCATRVAVAGINAHDSIAADFIDKTTFVGQVGVKLQKGDMSWGIGYGVNTSDHTTDQKALVSWQLNF